MSPKYKTRNSNRKRDDSYVPQNVIHIEIEDDSPPVLRRSARTRKATKILAQFNRWIREDVDDKNREPAQCPNPQPANDDKKEEAKRCYFAIATGYSSIPRTCCTTSQRTSDSRRSSVTPAYQQASALSTNGKQESEDKPKSSKRPRGGHSKGSAQQRRLAIIKADQDKVATVTSSKKIPRPPNAFMLFANEWRRKLANQYPSESNKDISVRLGRMWKTMEKEYKDRYFNLARSVDAEHKRKYPNYVYNPKEARIRKAMREQNREARNQMVRCQGGGGIVSNNIRQPGAWGSARQAQQRQAIITPRIIAEQQRNIEETKKAMREQVEHSMVPPYGPHSYLDLDSVPFHQLNSHMNVGGGEDYTIPDIESQEWLQYAQASQPNNSYMMRSNEEIKIEPWTPQYPSEAQMQAYNMKQQIMNGATHHYANNMHHQQMNMAAGSQQMMNRQMLSHNNSARLQEQNFMFDHPSVNSMANQAQNVEMKKREEPIQMLELMSAAASNNITIPTTSVTSSKIKSDSSDQQTPQSERIKSSPFSKSQTSTSMVPNSSENSKGSNETESNNCPLPAFETAFGSTEIGRYSHEGFFNTNQQLEMQQVANSQRQTKSTSPAIISIPEDLPTTNAPGTVLLPTSKIQVPDSLLPPSWSSGYYFSPGIRSPRPTPNIPMNGFTCFESSPFQHPSYAYYDYNWLAEQEYANRGNNGDALVVGVHPTSGYINGNEVHVALAGGSTVLAAGNTFCDSEGMNYVTLHIPADTLTSNPDPLGIGLLDNEDAKADDQVEPDSLISRPSGSNSIASSVNEEQVSKQTNKKANEASALPEVNDNEKDDKKKDDLENQDLITKMAMREPIVISETERICVLMDSPSFANDDEVFSFM